MPLLREVVQRTTGVPIRPGDRFTTMWNTPDN